MLFFVMITLISSALAASQIVLLKVTGPIGPATQDYIQRGVNIAEEEKASLVILQLDTPGGLEVSMRGIDQAILSSKVPVVTYVYPRGARAASAGTFLLYASHIAAMAPGTNVGAASPVNIAGPEESSTDNKKKNTLEKKAMNDSVASIRSLASLRHRNADWAEKAVREAASIPAEEALKLKVIDLMADSMPDLITKINGKTIVLSEGPITIKTENASLKTLNPDWRYQFLSIITDPSIAYILLLLGIYGIFFELANPGFVLPGVFGTIALLVALYAFQLLPINYVGLALLLTGIGFMILEVYVSSFGVLGVGGVIAFIIGSIMLLDTSIPGYGIAWSLILAMSILSALFFFIVITLVLKSFKKNVVSGREALMGMEGEVIEVSAQRMLIRVNGEIWQANSTHPLTKGQMVRVKNIEGLILSVEPKELS